MTDPAQPPTPAEREICEIEGRRLTDPAFGGAATHELRAVILNPDMGERRVVARIRYPGSHVLDLAASGHRDALALLGQRLEGEGWQFMSERGPAPHNLRYSRPNGSAPATSEAEPLGRPTTDWIRGLTKHTKRLATFIVVGIVGAAGIDWLLAGADVLGQWASILSIATALVWIMAATDDFRMGTHRRIVVRVENEGMRHPVGWYRAFLMSVVRPNSTLFGWLIPGSMYVVSAAYLSGIAVQLAALGALFLLGNMFLFLNLRYPRDDFASLTVAQVAILMTSPGGVPAIVGAVRQATT